MKKNTQAFLLLIAVLAFTGLVATGFCYWGGRGRHADFTGHDRIHRIPRGSRGGSAFINYFPV